MNDQPIRPGSVAAAAVVIGGILIIALPQYTLSIVQIVMVAGAVVAGIYALEVSVPTTGWMSPFKWMSPFGRGDQPGRKGAKADEVRSIRSRLTGWRQPIQHGPPMPPEALAILRPIIRASLDLDTDDDAGLDSARSVLSPLTWGVLTSDRSRQPYWFQMLPPKKGEVAEAVHHVLDEIDRLGGGNGDPHAPFNPSRQ